ncbi:hypothetical protein F5144DRAFT_615500 [Chaetomium tenue]|uniref:Uncharacterized protein n=1 Tax=Chaetomium tenue TaxID=1854479 RepID=A0ACB7P1Q8_9PEZI|nr:hypothetical protein F5144DRAFT_615500 [Chaetomium globosum]
MAPSIYAAQTAADLEALSAGQGGLRVLAQLEAQERDNPASRWSYRHLIAYRLLTRPETPILEAFKDHEDQCPVCRPNEPCSQKLDYAKTQALEEDACLKQLAWRPESEIMRLPDGFFWNALAQLGRNGPTYVNYSTAVDGSSFPIPASSPSEFELSAENLEKHEELRIKPDDATVHLVKCFLQYALNLCLLQDSENTGKEVRLRPDRRMGKARIAGVEGISAEDDGGICLVTRQLFEWEATHPYLAVLEAKRAFQYLHYNTRNGNTKPIVSNETLAQYLGEAVITWKANWRLINQDVFLIAASHTYLRIVHFHFGSDYEECIDATSEDAQRALVDNPTKDTCVRMQATEWCNIATVSGRQAALCNILALLRWHKAQGVQIP